MNFFSITSHIPIFFRILHWIDILEIVFLAIPLYYFSLWLKKDHQKNLLLPFFGYIGISLLAWCISLKTVFFLSVIVAPAVLVMFIILHTETLQKNFITTRTKVISSQQPVAWVDILFRSLLHHINQNKEVLCIIEQCSDLTLYIDQAVILNSPMQYDLLNILITSPVFDASKYIVLRNNGIIHTINTTFISPSITDITSEYSDIIYTLSTRTDAIIMHASCSSRTFSIITHNTHIKDLRPSEAFNILKKYSVPRQPLSKKESVSYDFNGSKRSQQELNT